MPIERAHAYILAWGSALLAALVIAAIRGRTFAIATPAYWRARLVPWKLALFTVAAGGMMLVAPRTGDPTWDWIDAGFMAALTYATAPWAVGVFARFARSARSGEARRGSIAELYVAACTWLLSASWSYDAYVFVRDAGGFAAAWARGFYPHSWSSNLVASSLLYAAGGACFSLAAPRDRPGRLGVTFAFLEPDWPTERPASVRKLAPIALVFVAVVTAMLAPFVWTAMRSP